MPTIIFVAVEAEPLERFELVETALVADLLSVLGERGTEVAGLLLFKEEHGTPLEHHHPLHGHDHPVFHAHRLHTIEAAVHYKADTFRHHFTPSATIATVTRCAVQEARLAKEEAEEHVLQLSETREQPALGVHLGTLARHGKVTFDLVRKKLVQG